MKTAQAKAHSNIALVKYWGKRTGVPAGLNLPAVGSLSMTLDALWTETTVEPAERDTFVLDDAVQSERPAARVWTHLDRLWAVRSDPTPRPSCLVRSVNHLPTAAGLASSASGFAALTLAGAAAFGLELQPSELSAYARMGSGSAARSVFGGFVRLDRGERSDGADCVAYPIAAPDHWPLRLLVVHTTRGSKPLSSTAGMERSAATSPYYGPWVDTSNEDLDEAQQALRDRNLETLGAVVEHSCLKMHACMMATRPPILYWNHATVAVMQEVWAARAEALPGYVTIDAGPHVKVLTLAEHADALAKRLGEVSGVEEVTVCAPGPDATVATGSAARKDGAA